jgi:hypothetical protein
MILFFFTMILAGIGRLPHRSLACCASRTSSIVKFYSVEMNAVGIFRNTEYIRYLYLLGILSMSLIVMASQRLMVLR